jgi:hypothetical protein
MKAKKFDKKLVLNKTTVTHLNIDELKNAHGRGDCGPESFLACPTEGTGCTLLCPTTERPTENIACTLLCIYTTAAP